VVDFQYTGQSALPNTATNITHEWKFFNNNQGLYMPSTSDIANPLHNFAGTPITPSNMDRRVIHKVTYVNNGQTFMAHCTTDVTINCPDPCNLIPRYDIVGCQFTPDGDGPYTWNWGDGSALETGTGLSHGYSTPGVYNVTITTLGGQSCKFWIRVDCGETQCCTADFTATITRECAALMLNLDAECDPGTHLWTIADGCYEKYTLQAAQANQTVQITDIDTDVTNALTITHQYTCTNGTIVTLHKTVPINEPGVFIGVLNSTTNLGIYNCAFPSPNNDYTGQAGKPVYVSGLINVDKNFTFSNTEMQFGPGDTGFDIFDFNSTLRINQNSKLIGVQGDDRCEKLWRGLSVYTKGRLYINNSGIRDAMAGISIRGGNGTVTELKDITFYENYVGVFANTSFGAFKMEATTFDGGSQLREAGVLLNSANNLMLVPNVTESNTYTTQTPAFQFLQFNSDRGFAGIYSRRARLSNVNFNNTAPGVGRRNLFTNLNYGIAVYNGDIDMRQNAIFSNIQTTVGYPHTTRTAGVALFDVGGSVNTCFWDGTLNNPEPVPDFRNCMIGMHLRSQNGMAPMPVGIQRVKMDQMRTGIYLDGRWGNGAFLGTANNVLFPGITRNDISTSMEGVDLPAVAGINMTDWGASVSTLEIYANKVICSNTVGFAPNFVSSGISAFGAYPLNANLPTVNEVDIHDNSVTVTGFGENGIRFAHMPNGTIRNNFDDGSNGNGVHLNGGPFFFSGIETFGGRRANVLCNSINYSTNFPYVGGLLYPNSDLDGNYIGNLSSGRAAGIRVEGDCTGGEIRCNRMDNNQLGLLYTGAVNSIPAMTGPQGTSTISFGNEWTGLIGSFGTGGALNENAMGISTSQWYYRTPTPPIETPIGNVTPGWFNAISNAERQCIISCPAPAQFINNEAVTDLDNAIASAALDYSDYPFADEQTWRSEFGLFRRLLDYPYLKNSSSLLQTFYDAKALTNIGAFWDLQNDMSTALTPSGADLTAMENIQNEIDQIEQNIETVYSLLSNTNDENQIDSLQSVAAALDSLLQVRQTHQQQTIDTWSSTASTTLSGILTQLSSLTTVNSSEVSLFELMTVYVNSIISSIPLSATQESTLETIASNCQAQHGPAVLTARMFCQGHSLPYTYNDCTESGDRGSLSLKSSDFSVSPNPGNGWFILNLPKDFINIDVKIEIYDILGNIILKTNSNGDIQKNLNLSNFAQGNYFVHLYTDKQDLGVKSLILAH
jgi:hypothetical protein